MDEVDNAHKPLQAPGTYRRATPGNVLMLCARSTRAPVWARAGAGLASDQDGGDLHSCARPATSLGRLSSSPHWRLKVCVL